jgi:hypothetical protein
MNTPSAIGEVPTGSTATTVLMVVSITDTVLLLMLVT